MKKTIILLNGYPQSGKDTFIEKMKELSPKAIYDTSWVYKIKLIAKWHFGWNGEKGKKDRDFLAKFCDLAEEYCEFCFHDMKDFESYVDEVSDIVIFVIRNPDDIEKMKQYYHNTHRVITVCIRRDSSEKEQYSNDADSHILEYTYDYYIDNNSDMNDFNENIKLFIKESGV